MPERVLLVFLVLVELWRIAAWFHRRWNWTINEIVDEYAERRRAPSQQ